MPGRERRAGGKASWGWAAEGAANIIFDGKRFVKDIDTPLFLYEEKVRDRVTATSINDSSLYRVSACGAVRVNGEFRVLSVDSYCTS